MCEVTADGDIIVGRARPKNNPLIHRSVVGKPAFHNDLPPLPAGYTFGAPLKRDVEGAGDVMLSWSGANKQLLKSSGKKKNIVPHAVASDPTHIFGAKSGISENMTALMQNRYELAWVLEQKTRHESEVKAEVKEKRRRAQPSRIALARMAKSCAQGVPQQHPKEYFTLNQFRNVPSRLSGCGSPTNGRVLTEEE